MRRRLRCFTVESASGDDGGLRPNSVAIGFVPAVFKGLFTLET